MTVNDTIHARKFLEHFTVDEPLGVALLSLRVDSRAIGDVILDQVFGRRHDSRGHVAAHDVDIWLFRVPYRDVAVCVDDIVVVEDVVGGDELAAELHKSDLLGREVRVRGKTHRCKVRHCVV
jgi:hypothetical protein